MESLALLSQKFDLATFLAHRFKGTKIEKYGREWAVPCPVCDGLRSVGKNHLYVNVEKKLGICYRCSDERGTGSFPDLVALLAFLENVDYLRALRWLRDQVTVTRADLRTALARLREVSTEVDADPMVQLDLPESYRHAWGHSMPLMVRDFYYTRGVTEAQRQRYRIGYTTHGYYANRSIVPVVMDGVRWTWVGRDMTGKAEKKVLYPKGSKTSRLLFNFDVARTQPMIVLVEGVYDAIRVGKSGVAILGTSLSDYQLQRLIEAQPRTLVVMLDPDAAKKATALGWKLTSYFPRVKVVYLGADPDEYTDSGLRARIADASLLTVTSRLRSRVARFSTH